MESLLTYDPPEDIQSPDELYCMTLFQKVLSKHREGLEILSRVEEVILQHRCMTDLEKNVKLYLMKNDEYIYSRTTFYRIGKRVSDIRVFIGRTTDYGKDLNYLINNTTFLKSCHTKIRVAMELEIEKNMSYVLSLTEKEYHCK